MLNYMEEITNLLKENDKVVIKFTAEWCNPCKRAAPFINKHLTNLPSNVKYLEIDIDESLDLYATLKGKRIITGIPSLLCYKKDNDTLYPDFCISSSDEISINTFFDEVQK